jgi:hypothetical protein
MGKTWNVLNYAGPALFVLVPLTGLFLLLAGSLRLGPLSQTPGGRCEATCTRCNPGLIAAFKAKGDWCATHDLPESQCTLCNPSLKLAAAPNPEGQKGVARYAAPGTHEATCTRCNPALIPAFKAKGDWCAEHNLPESQCTLCNPSLKPAAAPKTEEQKGAVRYAAPGTHEATCTKCNPALIPAYKAKGDWCAEHNLPKSQCATCNPGLKPAAAPKADPPKAEPMCAAHNVPESQCTICRAELKEPAKATPGPADPGAEPPPDKAVQPQEEDPGLQ